MKKMKYMSLRNRDIGKDFDEDFFKTRQMGEKGSKDDDIGTPLKLLHEGEGHRVYMELKNGDVCQGTLIESENNWTSQLESINYIFKRPKKKEILSQRPFKLEQIFIRGKKIRFISFPNMLEHASLFKLPNAKTKEEADDDLMLSLKLLHLTKYTQKIAEEQGRYYL